MHVASALLHGATPLATIIFAAAAIDAAFFGAIIDYADIVYAKSPLRYATRFRH